MSSNMHSWWRGQSPVSNPSSSGPYHSSLNSKDNIHHLCHPEPGRLPVIQILSLSHTKLMQHTPNPVEFCRNYHKLSSSLIPHAEPKWLAWLMNQPLSTSVYVVLHVLQGHLLKRKPEKRQPEHWLNDISFSVSLTTHKKRGCSSNTS